MSSVEGKLQCTLDSPDQGALNLPTRGATFSNNTLKIDASNLSASYEGRLQAGDSTIVGSWMQDNMAFPLNLTRQERSVKPARPQEPIPPFPYSTSTVTVDNLEGRATLSGVLTIPKGSGPFTAVVIASDIGPHNRDGEVLGHRPFWVLADYLARNGIASIRYDDRGVGQSTGNFKAATTKDFATDAVAAVRFLSANPKISKRRIGIIGFGEGGVVAAMAASAEPKVAFLVLMGAVGIVGEDLLIAQAAAQAKASGLPESAIRESEQVNRAMYAIVKEEPSDSKAIDKLTELAHQLANNQVSLTGQERNAMVEAISKSFASLVSPWYRGFLVLDPSIYYKRVGVPTLVLYGSHDLELNPDDNLKAVEKALRDGGNATFKVLKIDDLNHLFQRSMMGLPSEYGTIEETLSPDAMRIVKDWIKEEAIATPVK